MNEDRIEIWDRLTLRGRRYWWRARARNGRIVADCSESYNSAAARDHGLHVASRILGARGGSIPIVKVAR